MATLSNYLSSNSTYGRPSSGYRYPSIQRYRPYSPPKTNSGYRTQDSPFAGQDFAQALIASQQQAKAVTPSSTFENTYNYDPILSKLQALSSQTVANANTNAAQLRREAAITTGDPTLLQSLKFDPDTINAATQNPESLYAQLQKEYTQRSKDLEESMNARNLMYSGEYDRNLQELAQGRASAEGELGARLRELLSGADTGVLAAQETARQNELQAAIDRQNSINFGGHPVWDPATGTYINPTGYSSTGNASGTGTPTWFDSDGVGRSGPVPDGWVEHGRGLVNGVEVPVYGPPYSGPVATQDSPVVSTPAPLANTLIPTQTIDPLVYYLGGKQSIS